MAAPKNLESLITDLQQAPRRDEVTLGELLQATGHRSFGPALLIPGLLLVTPVGGVPGMATIVGLIALVVAGQLVAGRTHFWLPKWILRRRLPSDRLEKALKWLRRPAKHIDRLLRPRLDVLVRKPALQVLALACAAIGLVMPMLEVVPFADTAPGVALIAFGLAMIAHDGLLALAAVGFCAVSFALVAVAAF